MRRVLIALLWCGAAAAETPGEALFMRGAGAEAIIGGGAVRLPASRFACAGCHGADGEGRAEGGTAFPAIHWSALTARVAPYDATAVLRVLREGVAPDGRVLGSAMPRYEAPPGVMESLVAHLRGLKAAGEAIGTDRIRVLASGDAALDAGFAAAAARFNDRGGAYGRRLELVEGGPGIALAGLAEAIAPRLAETCTDALLTAMRQAGVTDFAQIGGRPADVAYRARAVGLTLSDRAEDILALGPPERGAAGRHYYGCLDVLGPVAGALVAEGSRVTIALPDRAAFDWARAGGHDRQAMRGYTLGGLLGQAARDAGRRTTGVKLTEAARALPVAIEAISLP